MSFTFDIFSISAEDQFTSLCIDIYKYQYHNNKTYREYADYLHRNPGNVTQIEQIPFLPIELFKTHAIQCGDGVAQKIFTSSGTTGSVTSKHSVLDLAVYEKSFISAFELFYGSISEYAIVALLPSYLERDGSSLVYMAQKLIELSQNKNSGFYLYNHAELHKILQQLENQQQKTILLGVSFALLDFADAYRMQLNNCIVMETGGMKGRRKELIREELHDYLQKRLGVKSIHSEYSMTELLSQAYSSGIGHYNCPPWMKIMIRDMYDPYSYVAPNQSGCINIIDLANYNSCSFIATSDIGRINTNGSFEVMGRIDNGDIRGCNLMVL